MVVLNLWCCGAHRHTMQVLAPVLNSPPSLQVTSKVVIERPLTLLIPVVPVMVYTGLGLFWVWSTIYLYTSCEHPLPPSLTPHTHTPSLPCTCHMCQSYQDYFNACKFCINLLTPDKKANS